MLWSWCMPINKTCRMRWLLRNSLSILAFIIIESILGIFKEHVPPPERGWMMVTPEARMKLMIRTWMDDKGPEETLRVLDRRISPNAILPGSLQIMAMVTLYNPDDITPTLLSCASFRSGKYYILAPRTFLRNSSENEVSCLKLSSNPLFPL